MVSKGGLPPLKIEWHSTRGGKPPFPTTSSALLNHSASLEALPDGQESGSLCAMLAVLV
jgi:hypothetical protein